MFLAAFCSLLVISDLSAMATAEASSPLEVTIEDLAVGHTRRTDWSDVACCLTIPNKLLQSWYKTEKDYIQLVNTAIRGHTVTLDVNCERLEKQLRRRAAEVAGKAYEIRKKKRSYVLQQQYLNKSTRVDVLRGETVDGSRLLDEIEALYEDISETIVQREGAEEAVADLKRQLQAATSTPPINRGLPLSQVSQRQQRRKVSTLKSATEKALWFVESFGVCVESVTFRETLSESPLVISYGESTCTSASSSSTAPTVPSDEALYQTLYLLERFGVSDEFYHELSMSYPSLARLTIIYCTCVYFGSLSLDLTR